MCSENARCPASAAPSDVSLSPRLPTCRSRIPRQVAVTPESVHVFHPATGEVLEILDIERGSGLNILSYFQRSGDTNDFDRLSGLDGETKGKVVEQVRVVVAAVPGWVGLSRNCS